MCRPFAVLRAHPRPVAPHAAGLWPRGRATAQAGLLCLAAWSACAVAQPPGPSDAASPGAPASVIAPPKPSPGDAQGGALRERLARQAFEQADRNGDGQLSREEAAALPGLRERFDRIDTNRDGLLSREEFSAGSGP